MTSKYGNTKADRTKSKLILRPTDAPNKIKFMTNINILHVSAGECYPWGVFQIEVIE